METLLVSSSSPDLLGQRVAEAMLNFEAQATEIFDFLEKTPLLFSFSECWTSCILHLESELTRVFNSNHSQTQLTALAMVSTLLDYCVRNLTEKRLAAESSPSLWRWSVLKIVSTGFKYISSADFTMSFPAEKIDALDCLIRSDNNLQIYFAWLKLLQKTLLDHCQILHFENSKNEKSNLSPVACISAFLLTNYILRHATMMKQNNIEEMNSVQVIERSYLEQICDQCNDIILFPLSYMVSHICSLFKGSSDKVCTIQESFQVTFES